MSWQAWGENKKNMELRKSVFLEGLRKEPGILTDQPKPGYGSTNTGNVARVFFPKFENFCRDNRGGRNFVKEVSHNPPNNYMPTNVHKVLLHGAQLVKHAILPI